MASYNEEIELSSHDVLDDLSQFNSVCQEIRVVMQNLSKIKASKKDSGREVIKELQIEACLHFLTLKKLNRLAQIRCKNLKDATLESKQKLDGNNLRLQNLQYEISHLNREVNNCLQFKSKHEEIDLQSVNEFYSEAPSVISKPDETKSNQHLQTLARLDWEMENRKRLKQELEETSELKQKVNLEISKKKQHLNDLRPCLDNVLKNTLQLQEALGEHVANTRLMNEKTHLLPRPLYVLFVQLKAYAEACDPNLELSIEGDAEEAKRHVANNHSQVIDATNSYSEYTREDSDSETEDREERESDTGRRLSTKSDVQMDTSSENIMMKHPLSILLKVHLQSKHTSCIALHFSYYTELEFVTVKSTHELEGVDTSIQASFLLQSESLFNDLQESDSGEIVSEKVKAKYFFSSTVNFRLDKNERAYLWVQKLAGLEFRNSEKSADFRMRFTHMKKVIALLRRRVISRVSLSDQLQKFSGNVITCDAAFTEMMAPLIHFKLAAWKEIDHESYCKLPYTIATQHLGLSHSSDHFYIASVNRGASANAEVTAVVSDRYPEEWPIFNIFLSWHGDHTASDNINVREMEVELNTGVPLECMSKKIADQMLSAQMYRLLSLLDVYVETDCVKEGNDLPAEFASDKLCPRVSKGRARLKPFKYHRKYRFQSHQ